MTESDFKHYCDDNDDGDFLVIHRISYVYVIRFNTVCMYNACTIMYVLYESLNTLDKQVFCSKQCAVLL